LVKSKKTGGVKMDEKLKKIKLLILDVDGVMTDGRIIIDEKGKEYRSFNVKDGFGIVAMIKSGLKVAIITSKESKVTEKRAKKLNIELIYQGTLNKKKAYDDIKDRLALRDEDICYIGDDMVDIPPMEKAGLKVAVADAADDVKKIADYITKKDGGKGAIREIAEMILKSQGKWEKILEFLR